VGSVRQPFFFTSRATARELYRSANRLDLDHILREAHAPHARLKTHR
jgi:hypothetical protein